MDNVASGAVKYLLQNSQVVSLVGTVPATDPNPANIGTPFIFRKDLMTTLQGTSSVALVCSDYGAFDAPVGYSTLRFQRLSVEIYADPLRSANNALESPGATASRCDSMFGILHGYLQRRDPQAVIWGDLITLSCMLLAEGQTHAVAGGDGDWMQYKQIFYGLQLGGFTDVAV